MNRQKKSFLATNPTVEGETTALYLSKLLEDKQVNVTRIAHGLPMGGHLDYADELTLIKAFEGRKKDVIKLITTIRRDSGPTVMK